MSLTEDEVKAKQLAFLGPIPSKTDKALKARKIKVPTVQVTRTMIDEGKSVSDVARERGLSFDTVLKHVEDAKVEDPRWNISHLRDAIPSTRFKKIAAAFHHVGVKEGGGRPLSPVKEMLGPRFTFEEIRLVRLFL
jgi:hypothetical protein